jgi:hypothetical protein
LAFEGAGPYLVTTGRKPHRAVNLMTRSSTMNEIDRNRVAPNDSTARYMNAYERAHARQHMEQAMVLADLSLRAWGGIRAAVTRVANLFRGQEGPGAGDTVVRRG